MFNLVLEKAEEPAIKFPTSAGSSKKQESSRKKKNIYFCLIDYAKAFDFVVWICFIDYAKAFDFVVWITTICGKILKRWEYQTTWLATWETCMQVRKQQFELDIEKQTGSK